MRDRSDSRDADGAHEKSETSTSEKSETPSSKEPVANRTRILVIDNYDSFVYNLVQYVGEVAGEVIVERNDAISIADVHDLEPTGIIISPGPGTPAEAGVSIPLFEETNYPILGVCLGHQALCAANGAPVGHAPAVVHGKPSRIDHTGEGLFTDVPSPVQVGRYHSLSVDRADLPDTLCETASTADERDVLMAVRHRDKPHLGVQFHPESILTREVSNGDEDDTGTHLSLEIGKRMIRNFCAYAAEHGRADALSHSSTSSTEGRDE